MKASKTKKDTTIASERFSPIIGEAYQSQYANLIMNLKQSLLSDRVQLVRDALQLLEEQPDNDNLQQLRYRAVLHVLLDLSQQGWVLDISDNSISLKMEQDTIDEKAKIRYRLSAERNAQFRTKSVKGFIQYMERPKKWNSQKISISNLVGDPQLLIQAIQEGQRVCEPYIQLVTDMRDELTGYKLYDIWRYFRYTWSIPYKTTPGRNLYYLVRDRLQPFHPVIGIFALGNSVLNLTVRDDDIGWTVDAIKQQLMRHEDVFLCKQIVKDTDGKQIQVKVTRPKETTEEYTTRARNYAARVFPLLIRNINESINDIYVKDLGYHRQTKYPKQEQIDKLQEIAALYSQKAINNVNNEDNPNWEEEARSNLYTRKRASELAKLLSAKRTFNLAKGKDYLERLEALMATETGRKAVTTALIANRKCKIGANMMDIIVCGAIPPYNELLCGKLISILACSPRVIQDYTKRYSNQTSEIASRMKGKEVVRDSHLVYLGTTSLYSVGSSQYNRIKVPMEWGVLQFRKMGITEGYGTVFFSKATTNLFSRILELQDGGKRISHVFGEGTSPRFRIISRGLSSIGVRADAFLKHYSPRIVYSIDLARNTNDFLMGYDSQPEYGFSIDDDQAVENNTQALIDYWYERWLEMRLTSVDIVERLQAFELKKLLLGNI